MKHILLMKKMMVTLKRFNVVLTDVEKHVTEATGRVCSMC